MAADANIPGVEASERIRYISHGEHRVLLLDFTNCTPEQVAEIADHVPALVTQEPAKSVLVVADFTGAEFTREAVERIKVATAIDRPYIKRAAWVLDANMPKAMYDSVRTFSARDFPVFSTREEALQHLVSADETAR
jgi:hypothetical protein